MALCNLCRYEYCIFLSVLIFILPSQLKTIFARDSDSREESVSVGRNSHSTRSTSRLEIRLFTPHTTFDPLFGAHAAASTTAPTRFFSGAHACCQRQCQPLEVLTGYCCWRRLYNKGVTRSHPSAALHIFREACTFRCLPRREQPKRFTFIHRITIVKVRREGDRPRTFRIFYNKR